MNFEYILAQPVLKIEKENKIRYIFAKHNDVEAKFSTNSEKIAIDNLLKCGEENAIKFYNDGVEYQIEMYNFEDCLRIFYDEDNKVVSFADKLESIVYFDNGKKIENNFIQAKSEIVCLTRSKNKRKKYDKYFINTLIKKQIIY